MVNRRAASNFPRLVTHCDKTNSQSTQSWDITSGITTRRKKHFLICRPVLFVAVISVVLASTMISVVVQMETKLEKNGQAMSKESNAQNQIQFLESREASVFKHTLSSSTKKLTKKQEKKQQQRLQREQAGYNNFTDDEKDILEIYKSFDDPPVLKVPIVFPDVQDFDPDLLGVVVVTKIQGPPHLQALRQMLCLFTKAYNDRVYRDIIVFTSEVIDEKDVLELKQIVAPAKIVVEIDNPGLMEMVQALNLTQQSHLLERCHVKSILELSWYSKCDEVRSYSTLKGERLAYNWQAEFRALHLWTHKLLQPYTYMMWMDSDAFCTRVWKQDPVAAAIRHDLVLLFDHFPQGMARGSEFPAVAREAFNRTICDVRLVNGTLEARDGKCLGKKKSKIHQVHGFFHVSNLDFYRSEPVMKWNRALIGDSKFSRFFDDQIGITIPAAVLAGNRSWDMKSLGIYPRVFHNYVIDGSMSDWRGYFVPWWQKNANTTFPQASEVCLVEISA